MRKRRTRKITGKCIATQLPCIFPLFYGNFLTVWLPPTFWDYPLQPRRLCWFGHVAPASPDLDHCRVLCVAIHGQPRDWKRTKRETGSHVDSHCWGWPETSQQRLFLCLAPNAWPDCLEWTLSDSHAPVWSSLLMMMNNLVHLLKRMNK